MQEEVGHKESHESSGKTIGRPIVYHVKLSDEERESLESLIRATTAPQSKERRAKIALLES